jgi:methyl-accepting chemotaxis protein
MLEDIARGAGDLTRRLDERGADEVARMAGWFNEFVGKLQGTVREVASSAVSVSSTSGSLSETAAELDGAMERLRARTSVIAGGSAEAATSLDKVSAASADFATSLTSAASAIEEMGATIRSVTASCREESRATAEARARAGETTKVVASLEAAVREVGGVVGVIEEIAGQTHLLALNAAIEAAGAGAAGKGFRIVADEVKALSQQTAEATGQIQQRVERMLAEAARAVHTVGAIGEVIGKVDELSAGIEHMLKEQSEAVSEISRTVSGLDASAREIAGSVKGSAAALGEVKTGTADVDREIAGAAGRQRALRVQIETLASAAQELETVAGSFRT